MAACICVTVSGPALSFLIYENVKSYCDQEGFLIGEIISHVTDTISDSQIRGEKTETIISINSLMPLPHSMSFYNGIGKINQEKLKNFVKDKAKEIVGWYRFRRNSSLVPHLRDRLLHKELSAAVPHVSPEHFAMCLLNTTTSNGGSTHIFNHKFMRYRHSKFEALPMQIHNLGETQPEYKLVPSTTCLSDSFNNIIYSLKVNHDNGSDAALVCHIQKDLQEHLWRLINDVASSEIEVAALEEEVEMLRQQTGPIPNEILLPQLLREDISDINKLETGANSNELSEPPVLTPINSIQPAISHIPLDNPSSNQGEKRSTKKDSGTTTSKEPFAYVSVMTLQMSQIPQATPNNKESSSNNTKRSTEKGRGTGRVSGRGARRTQLQQQPANKQQQSPQQQHLPSTPVKSADNSDNMPSPRRTGSTNVSPVRVGPQTNSARATRRGGYAQALKRSNIGNDSVKVLTRSQAAGGNVQDY